MTRNDAGRLFTNIVKRRPASFLVGIAVLGLGLRLLFSLGYWTGQPLTRDEREYFSLARSVAAGHGFVYDADVLSGPVDPFGRAPGYPLFLSLVGGGHGVSQSVPSAVKVAQSIVGTAGVVLVGIVAWRLAGPIAAVAAALVAACYPPLVCIAAYGLSEAIVWPLGLAAAWLFDRAVQPGCKYATVSGFLCGALTGATALVRPATIFFLLLAVPWLVWRRTLFMAAALALGGIVVLTPWTLRNYGHYGRFVLVASEGGVTFWTGNHPLAIGEGDLAANPDLKRESLALKARHADLTEEQMEPVYYRDALTWIGANPGRWLLLEVRKAFFLVVPIGPSYRLHSARYRAASVVSYVLLLPVALVGLWRLGLRRRDAPGLWLLAGSAIAACLVFFPQERFRIPVIDPVLVVCAGALFLTDDQTAAIRRHVTRAGGNAT